MNTANVKSGERLDLHPPHPLRAVHGTKFYRFFVRLTVSGIGWQHQTQFEVISPTAAAAANLICDEFSTKLDRPFKVETLGPKGGRCYRYRTWEGVVGAAMWGARNNSVQLALV